MALNGETLEIAWTGPFGWPKFENGLAPVPRHRGVYLMTIEFRDGYLIYAAGVSGRSIRERLCAHGRNYMAGEYHVFDVDALKHGVRLEVWRGWRKWFPERRDLFEKRQNLILDAAQKQLAAFRIFVADLEVDKRILERIESAIMRNLDEMPEPFCDIPDQGMWLAKKASSEKPILATNKCPAVLHGLPAGFEI